MVELNNEFGVNKDISVTTGLIHKYLGLTINFSLPRKVVSGIFGYLEDIILQILEDMRYWNKKDVLMLAVKGIFNVGGDSDNLDSAPSDLFHRLVARLLIPLKWGKT